MDIEQLPTNEDWYSDDWRCVLGLSDWNSPPTCHYAGFGGAEAPPVRAEDIAEVVHFHAVNTEGGGTRDLATVVRLADGTYAACEAWADYTGWGCQDGTTWKRAATLDQALGELSVSNRERFA